MTRPEVAVETVPVLARIFVERAERAARRAQGERGRFSIVMPGGSVAEAFFPVLAEADLDWTRADVFWEDERAVAPDHVDSNYGFARRSLLGWVSPRVHRMPGEAADLAAAASAYEREMRGSLADPARLDLALLGMGPDGHVCSLFPGHSALREASRWVVAIEDSPKPPPARITLTLPPWHWWRRWSWRPSAPPKPKRCEKRSVTQARPCPSPWPPAVFLLDDGAARDLA